MRKKGLFIIILLFITLSLFPSPSYLTIASTRGGEHAETKALRYFAKLIERRSSEEIKCKVISSSNPLETIEQLTFGGISIALIDFDVLKDYFGELYENKDNLESTLEKNNLLLLSTYSSQMRLLFLSSDSFIPLDLLNIGVVGANHYVRELEEKGARARSIELSDATELIIDGAISGVYAPILDFASTSSYSITRSVIFSDFESLCPVLLINKDIYYRLSKEERELLAEAAKLSKYYEETLLKRAEEALIARILKEKRVFDE